MKPSATFIILWISLVPAFSQDVPPSLPPSDPNPPTWLMAFSPPKPFLGLYGPVFPVGGGVTAPLALSAPDPELPRSFHKRNFQGTAVLHVVVDSNGMPRDIRILRSLGPDLDKAAVDAVSKWKFAPATKDGKALPAQINVMVSFRVY